MSEIDRVRDVYAAYERTGRSARWTRDAAILAERAELLSDAVDAAAKGRSLAGLRVLDLGCGRGDLKAELISAGLSAENIVGIDLLSERLAEAHANGQAVCEGSGTALPFRSGSFDLVVMFTVLSSVSDDLVVDSIQREVRSVLAPGGSAIVYDMRVPSPGNPAVRPVTARRLDRWFSGWTRSSRSCTVVPQLSRRVAARPGPVYSVLARVPVLRSHIMSVLTPAPSIRQEQPLSGAVGTKGRGVPTVSVIMPVRNEGSFIERSLGAVLGQVGVQPAEVIVVDGHSDDDTASRVETIAAGSHIGVEVIDNPKRIVPVSMNRGLARATGDVIVRVDGHCVIAPDYLQRCLAALELTGAECVGGPMETIGETGVARAIAAAQSSRFGVGGVAFRTSSEPGFVDTLAFGAYRRGVFDQIGWFDESFVRNQDDELNLRLTRSGGRIWMDPSIRSTYFSRGTLEGLWKQYHGYGFYKVRVMRKHRTVPSARHLVPAAFVAATGIAAAASLVRRSPWPVLAVLGPYAGAVAASSAAAARGASPEVSAGVVAAATSTMHIAYGLGWWAGAVRELTRVGAATPQPLDVTASGGSPREDG